MPWFFSLEVLRRPVVLTGRRVILSGQISPKRGY
jgi:hypothetical protein